MQSCPFPNVDGLDRVLTGLDPANQTDGTPSEGSGGPDNQIIQEVHPHLLGYPRIRLDNSATLKSFIDKEFLLGDLEILSKHFWMMAKQDHRSISPVHRQMVKGRKIIVSEDPRLHLIWYHDRIFIKPIPRYLLSQTFWETYLSTRAPYTQAQDELRKAALGFLRAYFYLICYESDFRIATSPDLCLIPAGLTWEIFCQLSIDFDKIPNTEVSGRYDYGEIRLTRLNFYTKFFCKGWEFHRTNSQYSDYFASFYAPILFIFGVLSVVLSAMQVELAVEGLNTTARWGSFWQACRWVSIVSLGLDATLISWLSALFLWKFGREWVHAIKDKIGKKNT